MAIRRYTQLDEDDEQFNSTQIDGVATEFGFVRRIQEDGVRTDTILDDIEKEKRQKRDNLENDIKNKVNAVKDKTGEYIDNIMAKAKSIANSGSNIVNSHNVGNTVDDNVIDNNVMDDVCNEEINDGEQKDVDVVNNQNTSNKGEVITSIIGKYKIGIILAVILILFIFVMKSMFNSNNKLGNIKHVDIKYEDNANVVSDNIEDSGEDLTSLVNYKRNYYDYESVMSDLEYNDIYSEYMSVERDFSKLVLDKEFLELVSTSYAEEFAAMVGNALKCNNMSTKDVFKVNMEQIANDCGEFDEDSEYNLSYYLINSRLTYAFDEVNRKAFNCIEEDVIGGLALMTYTICNSKYASKEASYGGNDNIYDYYRIRLNSYKSGEVDYSRYKEFVSNCEITGYDTDEVIDYDTDSDFVDIFGNHEDDVVEYNTSLCYHYKFILSNGGYFEFSVVVTNYCPFVFGFKLNDCDGCINNWVGDYNEWIYNSDLCLKELQSIADNSGLINNSIFKVDSGYNTVINSIPYIVQPFSYNYDEEDEDGEYSEENVEYDDSNYQQDVELGSPPSIDADNESKQMQGKVQSVMDNDVTVIDESYTNDAIFYSVGAVLGAYDSYDSIYAWVVGIMQSPTMDYDKYINGISDDKGNNGYYYLVRTLNESNSVYDNFQPIGRLSKYDTARDFLESLTWQSTNVYSIYKIYKSIEKYVRDKDNKINEDEYRIVSRFYNDIISATTPSESYPFSSKFPDYLN